MRFERLYSMYAPQEAYHHFEALGPSVRFPLLCSDSPESCYRIRNTFSVQQLPAERMQLFSHDRIVVTNGYSVCVHFLTRNHMHFNTLYHKTDRKTTLKDLQKSEFSIVILPEGVFSSQLFNFY